MNKPFRGHESPEAIMREHIRIFGRGTDAPVRLPPAPSTYALHQRCDVVTGIAKRPTNTASSTKGHKSTTQTRSASPAKSKGTTNTAYVSVTLSIFSMVSLRSPASRPSRSCNGGPRAAAGDRDLDIGLSETALKTSSIASV
jgi:hypothetical protein